MRIPRLTPHISSPFHAFGMIAGIVACVTMAGCGTVGLPKALDKTLQVVGIKETPPEGPPSIPVRLFAGTNLNAADDNRAIPAVVKIYQLRNAQRFNASTLASLLDQQGERATLGEDLISVNEVVLTPTARQDMTETLADGTRFIGIVALFRAPARDRWRLVFDARQKELPKDGITVGVHACALTTNSPALITRLSGAPSSLSSVRCDTAH